MSDAIHELVIELQQAVTGEVRFIDYLDLNKNQSSTGIGTGLQSQLFSQRPASLIEEDLDAVDEYFTKIITNGYKESLEFQEEYPDYPKLQELIDSIANRNLTQGIRVHQADNYKSAVEYYDRVIKNQIQQKQLEIEQIFIKVQLKKYNHCRHYLYLLKIIKMKRIIKDAGI